MARFALMRPSQYPSSGMPLMLRGAGRVRNQRPLFTHSLHGIHQLLDADSA